MVTVLVIGPDSHVREPVKLCRLPEVGELISVPERGLRRVRVVGAYLPTLGARQVDVGPEVQNGPSD